MEKVKLFKTKTPLFTWLWQRLGWDAVIVQALTLKHNIVLVCTCILLKTSTGLFANLIVVVVVLLTGKQQCRVIVSFLRPQCERNNKPAALSVCVSYWGLPKVIWAVALVTSSGQNPRHQVWFEISLQTWTLVFMHDQHMLQIVFVSLKTLLIGGMCLKDICVILALQEIYRIRSVTMIPSATPCKM